MKMAAESSDVREVKKLLKPLVEKRRRDRMNRSLDQLKSFLLTHSQNESFRNGKMEKAEILEMTVQYLKNAALANGPEHQGAEITRQNYEAGFKECLLQVNSFVRSCARFNSQSRSGLMEGLAVFLERASEKNSNRRMPECPSPSGPTLDPLRPGQRDSGAWDVGPAASNAVRPMAVVPAVASNSPASNVSHFLAARSAVSHQMPNPSDFTAKHHELYDSGSTPFLECPQKVIVSPKPVPGHQDSSRGTVSHSVWRPWP
ncbi:transcription factor HES-5-like [Chiloscyllium plagiosum]|uniref:transcription factor HES-5-like n=1 Tax=Chiloscyllium plagiosum TaxID=36176 RepID=UPI001CB87EE0|nr:transcription factor HES-5-like [Chiloscyllium plagiosum]